MSKWILICPFGGEYQGECHVEDHAIICPRPLKEIKPCKDNPGHRAYLPHGLTSQEKASPNILHKLSRCIKKVEGRACPKGFKAYDECTANPVAVCRASVK